MPSEAGKVIASHLDQIIDQQRGSPNERAPQDHTNS
jgi:hypothetical protein